MKRRWNIVRRQLNPDTGRPRKGVMGQWSHCVSAPLTEHELRRLIQNGWGQAPSVLHYSYGGIRIITCHTSETGYVTITEFFIRPLAD
jgi:hypothetical protein